MILSEIKQTWRCAECGVTHEVHLPPGCELSHGAPGATYGTDPDLHWHEWNGRCFCSVKCFVARLLKWSMARAAIVAQLAAEARPAPSTSDADARAREGRELRERAFKLREQAIAIGSNSSETEQARSSALHGEADRLEREADALLAFKRTQEPRS